MISDKDKKEVLRLMRESFKRKAPRTQDGKRPIYFHCIESRLKTALKNAGK